jgi:hypothetical protein
VRSDRGHLAAVTFPALSTATAELLDERREYSASAPRDTAARVVAEGVRDHAPAEHHDDM